MAFLLYKIGDEEHSFEIKKDVIKIGRGEGNDLILFDPTISRNHCIIEKKENGYFIRDLDSRNGLFLNGVKIKEGLLKNGDELKLGNFSLKYLENKEEMVVYYESRDNIIEGTLFRPIGEGQKIFDENVSIKGLSSESIKIIEKNEKILSSLTEVSKKLIEAVTYEEVLERIMEIIFEQVTAERGVILLYDEKRGELLPKVIKQTKEEGSSIRISNTIAKKAFNEKVAILCHDAQTDERFKAGASIRLLGIRSALCVPLIVQEKAIGLIYIDTPMKVKAYGDYELDLLSVLSGLCAVAIEQAKLREKLEAEKIAKTRLQRYHSPSVVKRILESDSGEGVLEAREIYASVLFADICDFTSITENMEPKKVSTILNHFLSKMTDVIFEYEGTLDKFIGDCVMAIFGAPVEREDHAERAIECALKMKKMLRELNKEKEYDVELNFRVGINSGTMVAGDIGSRKRLEYTVLGETVNIASRLQSSVAEPGQIVIGEETYNLTKGKYKTRKIVDVKVKGIKKTLTAYEVME